MKGLRLMPERRDPSADPWMESFANSGQLELSARKRTRSAEADHHDQDSDTAPARNYERWPAL